MAKTQTTTTAQTSKTASKATPKGAPAQKVVKTIAAPAKSAQAPKAKTAPKASAKTAQAPKAEQANAGALSVVAMIVEGIAKRIEAKSPFYARALQYHGANKTVFPRARNNETRAALKVEDVAKVFEMHDKKVLASGNAHGQAMFDVYMMSKA